MTLCYGWPAQKNPYRIPLTVSTMFSMLLFPGNLLLQSLPPEVITILLTKDKKLEKVHNEKNAVESS